MRDRLIELLKSSSQYITEQNSLIEKIADYLLANGVILPPCKIGDSLYYVLENDEIVMDIVEAIYINKYSDTCLELKTPSYIQGMMCKKIPFELIGKIALRTREEAEAALEERGRGNEKFIATDN